MLAFLYFGIALAATGDYLWSAQFAILMQLILISLGTFYNFVCLLIHSVEKDDKQAEKVGIKLILSMLALGILIPAFVLVTELNHVLYGLVICYVVFIKVCHTINTNIKHNELKHSK